MFIMHHCRALLGRSQVCLSWIVLLVEDSTTTVHRASINTPPLPPAHWLPFQPAQQSRPSSRQRMRMEQASARSSVRAPAPGALQQQPVQGISDTGPNSSATNGSLPEPASFSPGGGSGLSSGRRSWREGRDSSRAESSECASSCLNRKWGRKERRKDDKWRAPAARRPPPFIYLLDANTPLHRSPLPGR